jgi:hypothetical protein
MCIVVLIGIEQRVAISLDYSICSFALRSVDRGIQLGNKPSEPNAHGSALSRRNVFCHLSPQAIRPTDLPTICPCCSRWTAGNLEEALDFSL